MTNQEKALLRLWKKLSPDLRRNHMERIREDVKLIEESERYRASLPSESNIDTFDCFETWIRAAQGQASGGDKLMHCDNALDRTLGFHNLTTQRWCVIPLYVVRATKPEDLDSDLRAVRESMNTPQDRRVYFSTLGGEA